MWSVPQLIFVTAKIVCLRHHTFHEAVSRSLLLFILKTFWLLVACFPYRKIKIINLILLGLVKPSHDWHFLLLFMPRTFLISLGLFVYALGKFLLLAY